MQKKSPFSAHYHLPGLFEFYELYKEFLPLWRAHRDWFYGWCDIGLAYDIDLVTKNFSDIK